MITRRTLLFVFVTITIVTIGVLIVTSADTTAQPTNTPTPTPTPRAALVAAGGLPAAVSDERPPRPAPTAIPYSTPDIVPSVPQCEGGTIYARQSIYGVIYSCDLVNWTGPRMAKRGGD